MSDENIIDDQYQLVMCIASGSSSQVWEVVEQNTARHLAMKLLKKDVDKVEFAENKAQLKREAAILKSLDHPQIVKYDNYSSNRDHTYMLMEHFRASNLKLQIKADTNKVHLRARPLFEGVCSALAYVHQKGFVHRDIKPDNILMNKVGEIRLCDFSLSSKQVTGFGKMMAGKLKVIQGTRTYIAPETIRKQQPSFQTDMYSLGIVFFEVLALRTPFQAPSPEELLQKHLRAEAPNPSEFNPNVAPEMDRLIARLLKKKPADRPANVEEILQELKRIRIFKEDIVDEVEAKKASADTDALAMLSEIRLDSRADAKLKQMLESDPEFARKFAEEKLAKAKVKKAAADRLSDRIKVAEDADAARMKALGKHAPAAKVAPAPQPVAQPMPMPMQGYPMGYPSYPQGYMPYPQAQMPPMPMPPGMAAPFPPGGQQFPGSAQFAYPPQAQQSLAPYPPQVPQPIAAMQPPIPVSPLPPVPQPVKPLGPSVAQPSAPATARPAAQQVAQPAQRPIPQPPVKTAAGQQPPSAGPAKSVAPPAKPMTAVPGRPAPKAAPPTPPPVADLDFMTDLPDVL